MRPVVFHLADDHMEKGFALSHDRQDLGVL